MTGNDWDQLGVAWRASVPDPEHAAAGIEARLRRQAALARTGLVAGVLGGLSALALAAWTIWIGTGGRAPNFVTRGATIAVVGVLMLLAAQALGGDTRNAGASIREMLDLSRLRAERQARTAGLGVLATVVLAAGGLVGYAIRVRTGHAPAISPVEALLALAVLGVVLLWIRAGQSRTARSCRRLTEALALDEAA